MPLVSIDRSDDERIREFCAVPDPALLRERKRFVAEGRLVVRALITHRPALVESLLVSPTALESLRDVLERVPPAATVYVAPLPCLSEIVGFNVHRGCLALGRRPTTPTADEVRRLTVPGRPLLLLEQIGNPDNVGGIFRNALALGACGVLLSAGCSDPLYRKAIRVSIGATLRVPFAVAGDWIATLDAVRRSAITVCALTPAPDATDIRDPSLADRLAGPVALLLGSEGPGLGEASLQRADLRLRIPMADDTDSLNVTTAAGIALHRVGGSR